MIPRNRDGHWRGAVGQSNLKIQNTKCSDTTCNIWQYKRIQIGLKDGLTPWWRGVEHNSCRYVSLVFDGWGFNPTPRFPKKRGQI